MQGWRLVFSLSLAVGLIAVSRAGQTQAPPQTATPPSAHFEYDAARKGPLLMVIGGRVSATDYYQLPPEQQEALAARLDSFSQHISLGSLTVVVPQTMQVIETNPGPANPYADLKAEERLQALLSFFDAAQWELAGSAQGIGLSDMNEAEQALYLSLLPEKIAAESFRLTPTEKPGQLRYAPQNDTQRCDPLEIRLRLIRKTRLQFAQQNADEYRYTSHGRLPEAGDVVTQLTEGGTPRGDQRSASDSVVAFGVPILYSVPNRLKPGDLDFTASPLRRPITLYRDLKTLGDLLKRVAAATGLNLLADKRVAGLPILVLSLPGQQVRGADLLKALCWSVTGTFRRVGGSTYLLTDDIAGIGARFGKLEEWAERQAGLRSKAISRAREVTGENDPLSHIGFAPGDPNSLPPEVTRRIDDLYRNGGSYKNPTFPLKEMPASLQQTVMQAADFWTRQGTSIRTDRVSFVMEMSAQYLLPGGMAVTPRFAADLSPEYLQDIAARKRSAPPTQAAVKSAPPPQPMSTEIPRRVLLARLPASDEALTTLLGLAKSKGFTEVWLHVRLDDPQAPAQLAQAQIKARRLGLAIGASVSLLRGGGMTGEADVNILGETGAAFVKRRGAAAPQNRDFYAPFADWTLLAPDQAIRLLTPLARVPGLSALALKASAAPGWVGEVRGGNGIPTNAELGYGPAIRLACLREKGFDPIDVGPYPSALGREASLRYFPHTYPDGLAQSFENFRQQQNQKGLTDIHTALRATAPQLSLFLDDRASPYIDTDTCWFGRWDDPKRIAINLLFYSESVTRDAAFAGSPEPLLCCPPWSIKPNGLAQALHETSERARAKWAGLALDLTGFSSDITLRQLSSLPNLSTPPH